MNFYKRHLGDYAKDAGHLTMLEHGAYTLLLDRYYTTERPIASVAEAYRVCRARSVQEKVAVDAVLAEFFRTDGEAFLNPRAEEEIAKACRQRDINQEVGRRGGRPKKTESVSGSETDSVLRSETDSVSIRNPSQTPDSRHQTPEALTPLADSTPPEPPSEQTPGVGPPAGRYGAVSATLRRHGIAANPQHPRFMALVDAGATADEFAAFAAKAKGKGDPFAYVLASVEGERKRAAELKGKLHEGSMGAAGDAGEWHETAGGVKAMGEQLGVPYTRDDDCKPWPDYKRRVMARHREVHGAPA